MSNPLLGPDSTARAGYGDLACDDGVGGGAAVADHEEELGSGQHLGEDDHGLQVGRVLVTQHRVRHMRRVLRQDLSGVSSILARRTVGGKTQTFHTKSGQGLQL